MLYPHEDPVGVLKVQDNDVRTIISPGLWREIIVEGLLPGIIVIGLSHKAGEHQESL